MHTATTPTTQPMPLLQLTYTVPHAAAHLGMRAHQLFAWLRAKKYLYKIADTGIHLPYPEYAAAGYFVTHHTSYKRGPVLCHSAHTEITTTGLLWLAQQIKTQVGIGRSAESAAEKTALRSMASGLGVSENSLANDLEGVNYSSLHQGAIEDRKEK